jgi:hypothetical protein
MGDLSTPGPFRPGDSAVPAGQELRPEEDLASVVGGGPDADFIGLVDGSEPSSSRRFQVVLDEASVAELDELVATTTTLADGRSVTHYGIVVEATGSIEGAELPSDTARITRQQTMPGVTVRRAEVQLLRAVPEMWLHPGPGAEVRRATGAARDEALFLDQMTLPLPVGLDSTGQPIYADFSFLNGEKGGHISISGVSGVATKTSYATFFLYMLFETPQGRALLGATAPETRSLVFNVKGEDLLHLDQPNNAYQEHLGAAEAWRALGVAAPGTFTDVAFYAPRSVGRDELVTDVTSRDQGDLVVYGWPPEEFIRHGLLRFCFSEEDDAGTQISFVEERARTQLARWAYPMAGTQGAVVLKAPVNERDVPFVFERAAALHRDPIPAGEGVPIRDFGDLVEFLTGKVSQDHDDYDPGWVAGATAGTCSAFLRRLYASSRRLGHLVGVGLTPPELQHHLTVVDIHSLHDAAQRFVVGTLVSRIFDDKQGSGREPLRFIVLDELNKYAPRTGRSPIKEVLVDIAARGRSLGVLLLGAQQSAADVDPNIIRNAAVKVVGRLDAGEAAEYRFLTPELRERASRFLPGTMVLDQPLVPAPLPMRFPFPAYATCVAEARPVGVAAQAEEDEIMGRLD